MSNSFKRTAIINASVSVVWDSLTRPELRTGWMGESEMNIRIETDWTVSGPIVVRGFHHVPFENIGVVLEFKPVERLAYTHLSSLSRLPDEPMSYTTLQFSLESSGDATSLSLVASGFPTDAIFKHLQFYWSGTMEVLKQSVERRVTVAS